LVWQAKSGVDTFLVTHNTGGELNYEWLWVDLDGVIFLSDVSFFQQGYDPVFEAEGIEIKLPSVFDYLNSHEKVLYNEFPSAIELTVVNGRTIRSKDLLKLFNVQYEPEIVSLVFPSECRGVLYNELPSLQFDLNSQFKIFRTADDVLVDFEVKNPEFANLLGSFKINNFSDASNNSNFISDLKLRFSEIYLIQQNTQKCLQSNPAEREDFIAMVSASLEETSKQFKLVSNAESTKVIGEFIFAPQSLELEFNLEEGKTFGQIEFEPYHQLQQKLGLVVLLNGKSAGTLFEAFDYINPPQEQVRVGQTNEVVSEEVDRWLKVNTRALRKHLGAKVRISFYSGQPAEGYLESVTPNRLELRQLKYKGETLLPYPLSDIKSVFLINIEK
jgi:hypothetical protein